MKKKEIVVSTFAITILLLFVQCTNNKKELHMELTKRAAELNLSTPVVLETHTRFDSVGVTPDNVFQYFYTITNIENPSQLMHDHKDNIIKNMDVMYSTDKSLQFFIQNEVNMEYIYRDTLQNVIDVISIETNKYKK